MKLTVVRNVEEFRALRDDWNELLGRCAWGGPHLSWEWLFTWWQVYGTDGRELYLVLARDEQGALLGIAPCLVNGKRRLRVWPIRVLEFLGTGEEEADEVCSTYMGFIAPQGNPAVSRELYGHLQAGLARRDWHEVRLSRLATDFLEELGSVGDASPENCVRRLQPLPCAVIRLPVRWEDYLASLGKSWRKQTNRGRRNLAERGTVSTELVVSPDRLEDAFATFVAMHQQKWNAEGQAGLFCSSQFTRFHRALVPLFAQKGWVGFHFVRCNEGLVACSYLYLHKGTLFCYLGAYDKSLDASLGLGMVERMYRVEEAIKQGYEMVDFYVAREGSYKWHLAKDRREVFDLALIRRDASFRAADAATVLIRCARDALRSLQQRRRRATGEAAPRQRSLADLEGALQDLPRDSVRWQPPPDERTSRQS